MRRRTSKEETIPRVGEPLNMIQPILDRARGREEAGRRVISLSENVA